jgi:hypothetical protein
MADFHMDDSATTCTPASDGDDKRSSWGERCPRSGGDPIAAGGSSATFSRGAAAAGGSSATFSRGAAALLARGEELRSGRRAERQSRIAERMVSVTLLLMIVLGAACDDCVGVAAESAVPVRRCHARATALQLHEFVDACAAAASTGAIAGARLCASTLTDNEANSAVVTTARTLV